jgi:hypothetical protein
MKNPLQFDSKIDNPLDLLKIRLRIHLQLINLILNLKLLMVLTSHLALIQKDMKEEISMQRPNSTPPLPHLKAS